MNRSSSDSHMVALGAGIAIGVGGLILVIELLPLLALGGAGYLIYKGMENTVKQETAKCATGPQEK